MLESASIFAVKNTGAISFLGECAVFLGVLLPYLDPRKTLGALEGVEAEDSVFGLLTAEQSTRDQGGGCARSE